MTRAVCYDDVKQGGCLCLVSRWPEYQKIDNELRCCALLVCSGFTGLLLPVPCSTGFGGSCGSATKDARIWPNTLTFTGPHHICQWQPKHRKRKSDGHGLSTNRLDAVPCGSSVASLAGLSVRSVSSISSHCISQGALAPAGGK